jgi:hypothetical protein
LSQLKARISKIYYLFRGELDRFADALINIRKEIDLMPEILKHSPYTAGALLKK